MTDEPTKTNYEHFMDGYKMGVELGVMQGESNGRFIYTWQIHGGNIFSPWFWISKLLQRRVEKTRIVMPHDKDPEPIRFPTNPEKKERGR